MAFLCIFTASPRPITFIKFYRLAFRPPSLVSHSLSLPCRCGVHAAHAISVVFHGTKTPDAAVLLQYHLSQRSFWCASKDCRFAWVLVRTSLRCSVWWRWQWNTEMHGVRGGGEGGWQGGADGSDQHYFAGQATMTRTWRTQCRPLRSGKTALLLFVTAFPCVFERRSVRH